MTVIFDNVEIQARTVDGHVPIVRGVSCELAEARISVIGANGSGKSTLIRAINGLVTPLVGRVLVNGLDVAKNGPEVRRKVGFVFTDPDAQIVMPTASEDLALSVRRAIKPKTDRRTAVAELLERFGLTQVAHSPAHSLSGGQKQLLAIAGVLATNPQLILLDEPTTLLDLPNAQAIATLLFALEQDVIYATHDLELAARADRTLVIDDGRILYDGAPADAIVEYRSHIRRFARSYL